MKVYKKGVSLVAVLLFMLIATIASTATYKWLSSAGFSSASRMQMQEADYAAKSGIEAARSWMTYHGAETGAIIRQYLKNKRPILLDSVLNPIKSSKENYSVWFIGADIETQPYKIKLLSFGKSRGETAKYSKSAILNVNGLYRVKIPKEPKAAPFKEAVYSGNIVGPQIDVSSGVVNGDLDINGPVNVKDALVVSGDLVVNSSTKIKNLYVYGNLLSCTGFEVTQNTYVRGFLYVNGINTFGGDLYADGGIDMSSEMRSAYATRYKCNTGSGTSITVGGNTTVNDSIIVPRHNAPSEYLFKGNLVAGNGAKLVFPNVANYSHLMVAQPYTLKILGNVYLDGGINNDGFHVRYKDADKVVLGSAGKKVYSGSSIYRISNASGMINEESDYNAYWGTREVNTVYANQVYYRNDDGNFTTSGEALPSNTFCNKADCAPTNNNGADFRYNSDFYTCTTQKNITVTDDEGVSHIVSVGDAANCLVNRNEVFFQVNGEPVTSVSNDGWGANRMTEYDDAIETSSSGNCSGPHVKEPLQFNEDLLNSQFLMSKDNPGVCAGITGNAGWEGASLWYENNSVDRWVLLEQCYAEAKKAKKLYDGKWLLIRFTGKGDQFATDNGGTILSQNYIIIFDENNYIELPPTTGDANVMLYFPKGMKIRANRTGEYRNYFIFSKEDVIYNSAAPITGSLYLTDCHAVTTEHKLNADYNEAMTNALSESAVLCDNDGTKSCAKTSNTGSGDAGSGGSYDSFLDDGYDQYFVPVSPQLLLTVESEYKSTKKDLSDKSGEAINKSILVMPRVLYLPRRPVGKLSDYYDVVNLNGATEVKSEAKVYCNPSGIPTSERFTSYADSLKPGVYKCVYRTEDYEDGMFYTVVENTKTSEMNVSFGTDYVEIAKGATVEVPLVVPEAGDNAEPLTVDVYVTKPSNWTVSPVGGYAGTPQINANGSMVYKLTLTPGASANTVSAFEVTMPEDENSSNAVVFQLIPPCAGCVIVAPHTLTVAAPGTIEVERQEISKYCEVYPDNCRNTDGSNKYYSIIKAPPCTGDGLLSPSDIWVYATGANCQPDALDPNSHWYCNMHTAVGLNRKPVPAVEKYCETEVPLFDNSFSATRDGEKGTLYASIARKTKYLYVNVIGASNSNTAVYVRYSKNALATEPDADSKVDICLSGQTCQSVAYPGYKYFLEAVPASTDDKFSYFKCTGADCPIDIIAANPYTLLVADDNNTVVARFNDVDDHCFYEDFTPSGSDSFTAFCGKGMTRCVDTCAVHQSAGKSCSVTESAVSKDGSDKTPDWVMVYNNSEPVNYLRCASHVRDYTKCSKDGINIPLGCAENIGINCSKSNNTQLAPTISNNYITANNKAYSSSYENYGNGTQAVILSTKDAGFNGTFTSLFTMSIQATPNSGFIFRSNDDASEYYSLSVYGKAKLTGEVWAQTASQVMTKLCYVNGQTAGRNTSDKCVEKELDLDQQTLGSLMDRITASTSMTMVLSVKGAEISATFTIDRVLLMDGKKSVSFDIKRDFGTDFPTLADTKHNRVGMKLSDKNFKVHDISWMSEVYSEQCWAAPKIVCSFKSNYLGGIVPKDEEVTPWVSYSSFLNDEKYRGCKLKYYYNGCDMDFGGFILSWDSKWDDMYRAFSCMGSEKTGTYWDVGSPLSDSYYNFKQDGWHGTPVAAEGGKQSGIARDAKVILDCSNVSGVEPPSSLGVHQTCGMFRVGKMEYCSKSYDFELPTSCFGDCIINTVVDTVFTSGGVVDHIGTANLRDATLEFTFSNANADEIRIILVDERGTESDVVKAYGTTYSMDVNAIASTDDFDPQTVKEIKISSDGAIEVLSVQSSCPYALGVRDCSVSYNGMSWTVTANVINASSCDVEPSSIELSGVSKIEGRTCGDNATFTFENSGFIDGVSTAKDYAFKITAFNEDKSKYYSKICTSDTIKPITVHCGLETVGGVAKENVMKGTGVPGFNFEFENCDQYSNGKCNYTITLEGVSISGSTTGSGQVSKETTPFDAVNRPASPLTAGNSYSWVVTGPGNSYCNAPFGVYEASTSATADLCSMSDEGNFYANIISDGAWEASISIMDSYGYIKKNGIGEKEDIGDYFTATVPLESMSNGDWAVLVLNGVTQQNCKSLYGSIQSSSSAGVEETSSSSGDATGTSIMCHYLEAGGHNSWIHDFGPGKYIWKHNCQVGPGWWVYCNGSVIVDGVSYECNKQSNLTGGTQTQLNAVPKSGSIIEVPEGVILKKIGCEANKGAPVGCAGHSNEVIDGDGTVTPSTPTGKKTICIAANGKQQETVSSIPVGKYGLVQTCIDHVYYKCSGNVVYDGTALNCNNVEHSFVPLTGAYDVPELEVKAGATLSYLKCGINQWAWSNATCPESGVKDEEPPTRVGDVDCHFDKESYSYGENATFSLYAPNLRNNTYELIDPSGNKIKEGSIGSGVTSLEITNPVSGEYKVRTKAYGFYQAHDVCSAELNGLPSASCEYVESGKRLNVSLFNCSNGCNWYIKKDGSDYASGQNNGNFYKEFSEEGSYTFHLGSKDSEPVESCSVTIAKESEEEAPAGTCKFDDSNPEYKSQGTFRYSGNLRVSDFYAAGCTWGLWLDAQRVKNGTISKGDHYDFNISGITIEKDGTYILNVCGLKKCTASVTVKKPYAKNCQIDGSTEYSLGYGSPAPSLKFGIENCNPPSKCTYDILRNGNTIVNDVTGDWNNEYKIVKEGTYTVKVNNVLSDGCSVVMRRSEGAGYVNPGSQSKINMSGSEVTINGPFVAGTYTYPTNKSCSRAAFSVNGGDGKVTFNSGLFNSGTETSCSPQNYTLWRDISIPSHNTISFNLTGECEISSIRFYDCK